MLAIFERHPQENCFHSNNADYKLLNVYERVILKELQTIQYAK